MSTFEVVVMGVKVFLIVFAAGMAIYGVLQFERCDCCGRYFCVEKLPHYRESHQQVVGRKHCLQCDAYMITFPVGLFKTICRREEVRGSRYFTDIPIMVHPPNDNHQQ